MVSPRIPELKDCGCGVSLATGSKIISVVFCALSSIVFIGSLYYVITVELDMRHPANEERRHDDTYLEVISVMFMILSGVIGTLAFMLWYGVKEHRPSFVLPWAILTTAFTIIFTLFSFIVFLYKFHYTQLIMWIGIVVLFYCNLIVYSHFRELRREKNLPQTLSNNEAQ